MRIVDAHTHFTPPGITQGFAAAGDEPYWQFLTTPDPAQPGAQEQVRNLAAAHPDSLIAFAGLDPRDPAAPVAELDRALDLGARGWASSTRMRKVRVDGPEMHMLAEACAESDSSPVPVWEPIIQAATARGVPLAKLDGLLEELQRAAGP